jgi:subtilase family serine protease
MIRMTLRTAATVALVLGLAIALPRVASARTPVVTASLAAGVPHVAYRDLGIATGSMPISLAITLKYHRTEELERLIAMQTDASSPYYRRWLTSEQFNAAFAPTPSEYARVAASLRKAGFAVMQTFADRTTIDAQGTVASADRYFNTRIDFVAQPGYGKRYANVTPAFIPPDVRDLVFAVNGLHNLAIVHTDFRRVLPGTGSAQVLRRYAAAAPGLFGPVSSETELAGYGPLAFVKGYDAPSWHDVKDNGTGRSAGIVIDADYTDTDLAAYLSYFGVKRTGRATTRVAVDGGAASKYFNADSTEATLDAETLVSISPGVNLYMYEIPEFSIAKDPIGNITDAYARVVADNKVDTVNSSFGLCEGSDATGSKAWDHLAQQAAALGITFHASTGDDGAYACSNGGGVQAPASSPHVLAVGGTTLLDSTTGAYQAEEGWADSGGGISLLFSFPSYQNKVANTDSEGRNLPDVAFDADPTTGAALYYGGTWNSLYDPIGGTSLASPICGALLAQIEQIDGGKRLGLVAARLYPLASSGYRRGTKTEFHDVIIGFNGMYNAQIGYDMVTGIGSFDTWNLAALMGKQ